MSLTWPGAWEANNVANAMGTAIGSRVLSLRQALVLAGILEFVGAVFFSQRVVQHLASDITHAEQFADTPQVLALGMMAVLLASGIWIQMATLWGMPVSSTDAIVGTMESCALTLLNQRDLAKDNYSVSDSSCLSRVKNSAPRFKDDAELN
ncbi:MAG: inorganic phosphate transporter [Spirulina sp. SIO3F2]|nr:inorganic phosphate transporter [Spirulina sp. SIO3F2]